MRELFAASVALIIIFQASVVQAGDVDIIAAEFKQRAGAWTVHVTLLHADTGWDHYADGWRVVDEKGAVLGHRVLYHPHVNEQPFSRSLSDIKIPAELTTVFVEAHDKVHGWSANKLKIDLNTSEGEGYKVSR